VIAKQLGDETVNSVSAAWLIAEMCGQAADAHEGGLAGLDVHISLFRQTRSHASLDRVSHSIGIHQAGLGKEPAVRNPKESNEIAG
jgi:hypothetical protein